MAYYNPHITALYIPIQPKQPGFFSLLTCHQTQLNPPLKKKTAPKRGSHQLLSRQLEAFGRFFGGAFEASSMWCEVFSGGGKVMIITCHGNLPLFSKKMGDNKTHLQIKKKWLNQGNQPSFY